MLGLTRRRALFSRMAAINEFDRLLVTALILAKSPALSLERGADIASRHRLRSVTRVIVGAGAEDLEWLEAATGALGVQVIYTPIGRSDRHAVEWESQPALAAIIADVGHAEWTAEGDAVPAGERGTGQPHVDRTLRRIVELGRVVRRRAFDRDMALAEQYVTRLHIDRAAARDREFDRQRYNGLLDRYQRISGGTPDTWPF